MPAKMTVLAIIVVKYHTLCLESHLFAICHVEQKMERGFVNPIIVALKRLNKSRL